MAERLIIGMSGASGAPIIVELLRQLQENHPEIETHLILTRGAELTLRQECDLGAEDLRPLISVLHDNDEIGASIASGSFRTMGMIVVPCSMKTCAGIVIFYWVMQKNQQSRTNYKISRNCGNEYKTTFDPAPP